MLPLVAPADQGVAGAPHGLGQGKRLVTLLQHPLHEAGLGGKVLQPVGLGELWPLFLGGPGGEQELRKMGGALVPFLRQLLHKGGLGWKVLQPVGLVELQPIHLGGPGGRQELRGRAQVMGEILKLLGGIVLEGVDVGERGWGMSPISHSSSAARPAPVPQGGA